MSLDLLSRVFEETRLEDPAEKLLLLYLADQASPDGECIFDLVKAAPACCMDLRALSVRLIELEARAVLRPHPVRQRWIDEQEKYRHRVVYAYFLDLDSLGEGEDLQLPLQLMGGDANL